MKLAHSLDPDMAPGTANVATDVPAVVGVYSERVLAVEGAFNDPKLSAPGGGDCAATTQMHHHLSEVIESSLR